MQHHYADYENGFGVTSPFWDRVFGTEFEAKVVNNKHQTRRGQQSEFLNTIVNPYRVRRMRSSYMKKCSSTMLQSWDRFREPPLDEHKVRIRWTCQCGSRLWDDFKELSPGAAEQLCEDLDLSARNIVERPQRSANGDQQPGNSQPPPSEQAMGVGLGLSTAAGAYTPSASALGSSQRLPGITTTTGQSPSYSSISDEKFLLLCISRRNDTLRLLQLNVEHIKNDFSLFRLLQTAYKDHQGAVARYLSPRKLVSINFRKV